MLVVLLASHVQMRLQVLGHALPGGRLKSSLVSMGISGNKTRQAALGKMECDQ